MQLSCGSKEPATADNTCFSYETGILGGQATVENYGRFETENDRESIQALCKVEVRVSPGNDSPRECLAKPSKPASMSENESGESLISLFYAQNLK